jgi:hypothetical protein
MLKPPLDERGYTSEELNAICKEKGISIAKFNKVFGCNTCILAEDGKPRFYACDVERALEILGDKDGKFHEFD